jgi:hypothetical protein
MAPTQGTKTTDAKAKPPAKHARRHIRKPPSDGETETTTE